MDLAVQAFFRRLKAGERLPPFPRRGPLRQRHLPPGAGRLPSRCGSSAPARPERGVGESPPAPAPPGPPPHGHHSTPHHPPPALPLLLPPPQPHPPPVPLADPRS